MIVLVYLSIAMLFAYFLIWNVERVNSKPDYSKIILASIVWPLTIIYITLIYKE